MAVRKKCAKRICNDDRLSRVLRDYMELLYIEPTYALAVYFTTASCERTIVCRIKISTNCPFQDLKKRFLISNELE